MRATRTNADAAFTLVRLLGLPTPPALAACENRPTHSLSSSSSAIPSVPHDSDHLNENIINWLPTMSASASPSTGSVPPRTRDNARFLLQRLHASPAKVVPLALNQLLSAQGPSALPTAATLPGGASAPQYLLDGTGLGTRDVVIARYEDSLAYPSPRPRTSRTVDAVTALHQWQLQVAALHAMRGGRVALVYAPGTRTFALEQLAQHLERLAHAEVSDATATATAATRDKGEPSPEQAVADQQARVLAALARITVISCRDVEDLSVFCHTFAFPPAEAVSEVGTGAFAAAAAVTALVVPLVMCFGLCGRGSYVFHYERAAGREVPLRHWLLCELRRRLPCALIVLEWPSTGGPFSAIAGRTHYDVTTRQAGKRPRDEDSAALQGPQHADLVARFTAPHHHPPPAPARAAAGATTTATGAGPLPAAKQSRTVPDTAEAPPQRAPRAGPVAELTDSQFFYVSLSCTTATLQKLRLSDGSAEASKLLSRTPPWHQTRTDELSSSDSFSSELARQPRGPGAIGNGHRQPRCTVEAHTCTPVQATDFLDGLL